jgi:Acyl-protein synthetase, LuxE
METNLSFYSNNKRTMSCEWGHKIFNVYETGFDTLALEIFHYQYKNNSVYRDYVDALQVKPNGVGQIEQIPFLPIRFFKTHTIQTSFLQPEGIFESSGTTQSIPSRHYIKDLSFYEESFQKAFQLFYGPVEDWCIIGLLPSYLERKNASLVYMVNKLITRSGHLQSGFYLYDYEKLYHVLLELEQQKQRTWLIGVSFALLDFANKYTLSLPNTTIVETGGMKGRGKPEGEMIRLQVHEILKKAFDKDVIHSEYGMTELLSQAYSKGEGIFKSPPWMKILVRDDEDPLMVRSQGDYPNDNAVSGAINVIDLANVYSCSFVATDDVGRLYADGSFEVLGRMDNSDLRGCSLMVAGVGVGS